MGTLLPLSFITICSIAKTQDFPPNPEAGKCYAKFLIEGSGKEYSEWNEVVCD